jgi:hypothetical protein
LEVCGCCDLLALDRRRSTTSLLRYVGQLVREEPLSLRRRWRVLAGAEHDVVPDGIRSCAQRMCRICRLGISMHAYAGEVVPQTRPHALLDGCVEWLSQPLERPQSNGRNGAVGLRLLAGGLHLTLGRVGSMVGGSVCLLLVHVSRAADLRAGLNVLALVVR